MDYSLILYGLAFECPYKREQESCSLCKIRSSGDFKEKVRYINSLTQQEQKEIYIKHTECVMKLEDAMELANEKHTN